MNKEKHFSIELNDEKQEVIKIKKREGGSEREREQNIK